MQNRLKQLPLNVQKHVYEIAGIAGTSCPNWGSEECSNDAKDVHHYNYDRVGKERVGMDPEALEENDLIALCRQCHADLHAEGKIT